MLCFRFISRNASIRANVVINCLTEDPVELDRFLTKLMGCLQVSILVINLDQHLLVAAFGDLPCQSDFEQDVCLVKFGENLLKYARLALTLLIS